MAVTTDLPPATLYLEPTELQDMEVCPRILHYRKHERLVPKRTSPKLYKGKLWHIFLERYYTEGHKAAKAALTDSAEAEKRRIQSLVLMKPEEEAEFDEAVRLLEVVADLYDEWATEEDPKYFTRVIAVEQPFEIELIRGVVIAGRIDMVVEDRWGNLWPWDNKSTSSSNWPDDSLIRLNTQFRTYWLAVKSLAYAGVLPDRRVPGFVYNGARFNVKNPRNARTPLFYRRAIRFPEAAQDTSINNLVALVEEYQLHQRRGYFRPQPGQHCVWRCPYTELCLGEENQTDVSALRDELFVVHDGRPNYLRGDGE